MPLADGPDGPRLAAPSRRRRHGGPRPWGVSVAANITPTNLADWSDAAIKQAITTGVRADGTRLLPPMGFGYYKNISASDLDAYLRSLPAR